MNLDTVIYSSVTAYDLLLSFVIITVSVLIAKIISLKVKSSLKDKASDDKINTLSKAIHFIIILIGIFSVMPILNFNLSGLLVAGGFLGIVIGFASQSVVSNMLSGILLTFEKPFRVNDVIRLGGEEGTVGIVEDTKIISTTMRTFDGVYVRVPNEKVFTGNITNFLENVARRFEYLIGIRYKDDAEKAIEIIKDLIEDNPLALKNPEPQVFVEELGNSAVKIRTRIWAPSTEWFQVRMKLLWQIKKELEENDIEIPFDQREIWFKNALQETDNEVK